MGSRSFSLPNELIRSAFKHHSVYWNGFIRRESSADERECTKTSSAGKETLSRPNVLDNSIQFLQVEQRLQFFPNSWDMGCRGQSTLFEQQSMGYKQADVSPLVEPRKCPDDAWAGCPTYLKRQAKHWALRCLNRDNSRDVEQNMAPNWGDKVTQPKAVNNGQ